MPLSSQDVGGPAQPLMSVRGLVKHFPLKKDVLGRGGGVVRAVDGIDFDLQYARPALFGLWRVGLGGTYNLNRESRAIAGARRLSDTLGSEPISNSPASSSRSICTSRAAASIS